MQAVVKPKCPRVSVPKLAGLSFLGAIGASVPRYLLLFVPEAVEPWPNLPP